MRTYGSTISEMTAAIRELNVAKGWRPAEGGPGENTFGDYQALLHSEVSEALEAYRSWRLADATEATDHACPNPIDGLCMCPAKPEGVGSELADVLIRLLDMADVFGVTIREHQIEPSDLYGMVSFGDHITWLHLHANDLVDVDFDDRDVRGYSFGRALAALDWVAVKYGIDLDAEYRRKMAYNWTRPHQHGGRTLAGPGPQAAQS